MNVMHKKTKGIVHIQTHLTLGNNCVEKQLTYLKIQKAEECARCQVISDSVRYLSS